MSTKLVSVATLFASILAPLAANADGRCVLAQLESLESNRAKSNLIFANDIEIPANAKEIWWKSNDGTVKLQMKRLTATATNSEIQTNVLVNDGLVMRATGRSTGNFLGAATSFASPDGRAFSLTCIAQEKK